MIFAQRPPLAILSMILFAPLVSAVVVSTDRAEESDAHLATVLASRRGQPRMGPWGFNISGQNLSIRPGDDFYGFANGRYVNELSIPSDQSSWGPFSMLHNDSEFQVREILEEEATRDSKVGKFYASFMDEATLENLGGRPVAPYVTELKAAGDKAALLRILGNGSTRSWHSPPIGAYISPDDIEDRYAVKIDQAGLGLPRDYYLEDNFKTKIEGYRQYIERMLRLADVGMGDERALSERIVAFETRVANVSASPAERRDPVANYNPMTLANLTATAPGIDWSLYLDSMGPFPSSCKLVVGSVKGVVGIAKVFDETDLETLKAASIFHLLDNSAAYMSNAFVDSSFQFYKTLSGQANISARWKRGVRALNSNMGMAVGQIYVERHFPPASKTVMVDLVHRILEALNVRINGLTWMTEATKRKALKKLETMDVKIGYPDKWKDYSALTVSKDDLFGNMERSIAFEWEFWMAKISPVEQPVDRELWGMNPQEVNAYYAPDFNQIVFPAAILQPPFFDADADMAVNYGGIGAVIGHEITHGFDDQGRHYDERGRLHDWWTEEDAEEFQQRATKYGTQFETFRNWLPSSGHINPRLTMGENLADLGGVAIALSAYHSSLAPATATRENDRRFFLGFGQVWSTKVREDALVNQLVSDPHSPSSARATVPLRNMEAWYRAFDVRPSDAMYLEPRDRVVV